jgi:putative NADH-flavin reductase
MYGYTEVMNITVFGATGKVGRLLVAELLAENHHVTAFVHTTEPRPQPQLTILHGSIEDQASIVRAIAGADIVMSALGSWGSSSKDIVSSATEAIIPAMQANGVMRFISVTGSAALAPGDAPGRLAKLSRKFLSIVAPKILADGEQHIALLATSPLDWTVIRSPAMLPGKTTEYRLSQRPQSLLQFVSRRSVVQSMLDQIDNNDCHRLAPIIYQR